VLIRVSAPKAAILCAQGASQTRRPGVPGYPLIENGGYAGRLRMNSYVQNKRKVPEHPRIRLEVVRLTSENRFIGVQLYYIAPYRVHVTAQKPFFRLDFKSVAASGPAQSDDNELQPSDS
jgi:hypothetical protein